MYSRKKPLSRQDRETLDESDYTTREERNGSTGGKDKVTRFSDGSAIRHCGGPVGDVHTDQDGEEC